MWQNISSGRLRATRALRSRTRTMLSGLRTAMSACDLWIQDHCMLVFITLLGLGLPSLGLLLLWKWVQVITLAKQLAPVLTVTSITITGLMGALRWFKARRDVRMRSDNGRA